MSFSEGGGWQPQDPNAESYDPYSPQPYYPTQPIEPTAGSSFGTPAYGQPAYPPPAGPGGPIGPIAPVNGGDSGRRGMWAAIGAIVVVAAMILAYFLFFAGASGASSPTGAVSHLLDAGKKRDVAAAKKYLCKADLAGGLTSRINADQAIDTYRILGQSKRSDITYVSASVKAVGDPSPSTLDFPVVKEGGAWKVCFRAGGGATPGGAPASGGPTAIGTDTGQATAPGTNANGGNSGNTGLPSQLPTGFPSALPSELPTALPGGASICANAESGRDAAVTYVGAAEIGGTGLAQSCVYQGIVPQATTAKIAGHFFAPRSTDPNATVVDFASVDGSTQLTVTTAKKSDGKWYVVGVKLA
jgi:hypothetical protein